MAEIIALERLIDLLAEARDLGGARYAWIDQSRLQLGAEHGRARYAIDLGAEALRSLGGAGRAATSLELAGWARPLRSAPPVSPRVSVDGAAAERHGALSAMARPGAASASPLPPPQFELPSFPGRGTGAYRLVLEGQIYAVRSQKELLLIGLSAIERARPGSLEKLAKDKSRTKRVVARSREALNDNPSLAERFSSRIEGGWWVFTNNSFPETEKFLRRAGFHAGLHVELQKLG